MSSKTKTLAEQASQVETAAEAPKPEPVSVARKNLLSTGSTLLNLACSGNAFGGFLKGKYYFIVGDSTSGKTFFSMSCFAEAVMNKRFKDYRLIYDNIEDGCLMDLDHLFNEEVADRVEPPAKDDDGEPLYSSTIEHFYYNLDDACKAGRPFIYVLDSMDALTSDAADEKFDEQKKADREGKEAKGSYGDGKAKKNSEMLRTVLKGLRTTGSILIILSQTRDNIGGYGKTRSGGNALRFYATTEIWTSVVEQIIKTVKGKKRQVGTRVALKTRKNRITGKLAEVQVDIYPSYGIDDIGSMVDYLVEEGWWEGKETISAPEFNFKGTREKLIRHLEDHIAALQELVGECWAQIDAACALKRRGRYAIEEGSEG